eukprot:TRINITY_DN17352_c0_g1_i1.p1 TRINITY_DN17352_c0_g1~~TRINITY_DN17352_c0_g1_i1.p1  ORF type:complete len:320 (-),score=37.15 TRINITY_DN17352_c0_g1_i1:38-997(-)
MEKGVSEVLALREVDEVEVTILVDNFVDVLISGNPSVKRFSIKEGLLEDPQLIAEHGYALLLTVKTGGSSNSVLYDAGLGRTTLVHNMETLGIPPSQISAIVLSHGHADHHGGLPAFLAKTDRKTPLVVHPEVWRKRKVIFPGGTELLLSPPDREALVQAGAEVVEKRGPQLVLDGTVLVTGEVERKTTFEEGMKGQLAMVNGQWEPDPWIWDDQGLVVNVKNKGLVILSSCSHAGVINILHNAQRLTGVEKIHAFVGGLHLSGAAMEPKIPATLQELAAIGPEYLVPGHCTGWKCLHQLSQVFPQAYIQSCVGTRLIF